MRFTYVKNVMKLFEYNLFINKYILCTKYIYVPIVSNIHEHFRFTYSNKLVIRNGSNFEKCRLRYFLMLFL